MRRQAESSIWVLLFFFSWRPAERFCSDRSLLVTHFRSAATEREATSHSRIYSQPLWERWNIRVTVGPLRPRKRHRLPWDAAADVPKVPKWQNSKLKGTFYKTWRKLSWDEAFCFVFFFLHNSREMAVEKINHLCQQFISWQPAKLSTGDRPHLTYTLEQHFNPSENKQTNKKTRQSWWNGHANLFSLC